MHDLQSVEMLLLKCYLCLWETAVYYVITQVTRGPKIVQTPSGWLLMYAFKMTGLCLLSLSDKWVSMHSER